MMRSNACVCECAVQCTRAKSDRLFYLFIVVKISNFPVGPSSVNGGRGGGGGFFSARTE